MMAGAEQECGAFAPDLAKEGRDDALTIAERKTAQKAADEWPGTQRSEVSLRQR